MFIFNLLGTKVVLFCVKAVFNGDEVCLSFCGDNGVRSVLLNASIQYPLVQVRELQEFYIASEGYVFIRAKGPIRPELILSYTVTLMVGYPAIKVAVYI